MSHKHKSLIGRQLLFGFDGTYRTTILTRNYRSTILNRMVGGKWAVKIHSSRTSRFLDKKDLLLDGHLLLRFFSPVTNAVMWKGLRGLFPLSKSQHSLRKMVLV
ncbi:hypothetical protein CDAR_60241 [Caerostris darwini]|uniref:Uncharacterized protein n=1 Tax=Caerostris darwini TaxID=1538125 RepID=A0AAV4QJA0_9ARAC|nr:hypothetical protein CDAR_60241 [Caerostris darwini]